METKTTHEKFKKAMQEAWEHVDLDKETVERSPIPEPDLSFLEDLEPKSNKLFAKPKRNYRLAKIAVFIIAVFLTSSVFTIFINSQASYGVKSAVQNIKHFFSENEPIVDENGVQSLILTDWKDISDGKKIAGTLYVPSYIPEGYEFQEVSFDRVEAVAGTSYHFSKGKKELYVDIKVLFDDVDVYVAGEVFQSPFSEKEMYFEETDDGIYIAYAEGDHNFSVVGDLSKEEGTRIIEEIVEQK